MQSLQSKSSATIHHHNFSEVALIDCPVRWGDNGLEFDQNQPRQQLCDWLDKAGGVALFDFVTKGVLNEAVKNTQYWRLRDEQGKNPGLTGWWPSRSVTFIDNHDTGSRLRSGPQNNIQCNGFQSSLSREHETESVC